jgi:AmmeMemoRadiSam system protein A
LISPRLANPRRRTLLNSARSALGRHLRLSPPDRTAQPPAGSVEEISVFVTLRSGRDLRGCIGLVGIESSLEDAVASCAVSAASDPRFEPVTADEASRLLIEISVLSPPMRISDPAQLRIGRDGIQVSLGTHRGLFLPHVAIAQGWNPLQFVEEVCRKAGLPPDAWGAGAELRTFQAEVWEGKLKSAGPGFPDPTLS